MGELSQEERLVVARARKIQRFLSQPFQVAETFTGTPGVYVALADALNGFDQILNGEQYAKTAGVKIDFIFLGELDHVPENAFYMVGDIDEVLQKAEAQA